jgi:hypothetical protein
MAAYDTHTSFAPAVLKEVCNVIIINMAAYDTYTSFAPAKLQRSMQRHHH